MRKQRRFLRVKDEEEEKQPLRLVSKTRATKDRNLVRYMLTGPEDLDEILARFLAPRDVENTALLTWES